MMSAMASSILSSTPKSVAENSVTSSGAVFSFSPAISRFPSAACHLNLLRSCWHIPSLFPGARPLHHPSVRPFPPRIPAVPDSWTGPGLANSPCKSVPVAEGFAPEIPDTLGGPTLDDSCCHDSFAPPTPTLHRRYEALRAVVLDHRPWTEVARQFGYRSGTLRDLVAQFPARCRTGPIPPVSPPRLTDAPRESHGITPPYQPIPRPRPIAINWFSRQAGASQRAGPESFSCSPSWPNSGAMPW
jgi:hypothetical protein